MIQIQKVNFHWEFRDGLFRFNRNTNYVVYFNGCFAPPHLGHFSAIYNIIKNNTNVKVIISQIGERHGVPYEINKKIWSIYIKNLLPKNRVLHCKQTSLKNFVNHEFLIGCNKIVILRANEDYNMQQFENFVNSKYSDTCDRFKQKNISVDFYVQERSRDTLSATIFVKNLIDYRDGKINKADLLKFLPKGLLRTTYDRIISTLIKCELEI